MKKLVLYDIDGTLVSTGGAGTRAMDLAFKELFGIENAFLNISMAGKTDPQIMKEGLMTHGLPYLDGNVDKMKASYLSFLQKEINNPEKRMNPGIMGSLEMLQSYNVPLGLLTGNLEQGARIKLGAFGLNDFFRDGAFGSDNEDRDRLLPVAIDKFRKRGLDFVPEECIIIGDTPRDVRCAKIHNAYCIAVATGPYSKDELLKTDADLIVDSLLDIESWAEFIG